MKRFPFVVFEDHIVFNTRFRFTRNDNTVVENYDPDYFITKFGYFIPTSPEGYSILDYLKDPTEENQNDLTDYNHEFYLITNYGKLLFVRTSKKFNYKFFTIPVNTGKGIRGLHQYESGESDELGALIHIAKDYEHFIELFDKTLDPNKNTQRAKFTDIAARMRSMGNAINIINCEYTFFVGDYKE